MHAQHRQARADVRQVLLRQLHGNVHAPRQILDGRVGQPDRHRTRQHRVLQGLRQQRLAGLVQHALAFIRPVVQTPQGHGLHHQDRAHAGAGREPQRFPQPRARAP
ncbi:hypothetical protein D3C78_1468550 [compost metagenome]